MQLKWELGSPLFGLILRRYAPHDIYEVGALPFARVHLCLQLNQAMLDNCVTR